MTNVFHSIPFRWSPRSLFLPIIMNESSGSLAFSWGNEWVNGYHSLQIITRTSIRFFSCIADGLWSTVNWTAVLMNIFIKTRPGKMAITYPVITENSSAVTNMSHYSEFFIVFPQTYRHHYPNTPWIDSVIISVLEFDVNQRNDASLDLIPLKGLKRQDKDNWCKAEW
jgi:hypothetical protein